MALSTTAKNKENESTSLLQSFKDSTSDKKWNTFQCFIFCLILIIITNIATNFDRIYEYFKEQSSDKPILNYPSRCNIIYQNDPITSGMGDRRTGHGFSGRSASVGLNGMVSSSQPLVSQTAINILKRGGNAVDAAIAANAMSGLVEPTGNGIGGDIMFIIYNPSDKKLYGYNGSGRSSMNFTYQQMRNISNKITNNSNYIPTYGAYAISIPGAVQGWCDMHQRFGNLSWNQLFEDAINQSRNGFAVTQIIAERWQAELNAYLRDNIQHEITQGGLYPHAFDGWLNTYTDINNNTPKFGDVFINEALGNTLELIANGGCDEFYRGNLSLKMVDYLQSFNSPLTYDDFANHYGSWINPVNITYRDNYLISELADNMQGIAVLQMLNMLELYNINEIGFQSVDYLHINIEIKKLVFADRAKYYADDSYLNVCIPIEQLISKEYAIERNKLINLNKASIQPIYGNLSCINNYNDYILPIDKGYGDTIYLTTADSNGMMVSLIQSNYNGFGSGLTDNSLGFTFQNRGALFSLINNSANQYNPGKRPFHTIIPGFIHIKNETNNEWLPYMSFGVMGGAVQPQGHTQIVSNIIDFGMNIQECGDVSRWTHSGSQQPTGQNMSLNGGIVELESGICQHVANKLIDKGHIVRYSNDNGGYQGIIRDPISGTYFGGTEMRKDGISMGY